MKIIAVFLIGVLAIIIVVGLWALVDYYFKIKKVKFEIKKIKK